MSTCIYRKERTQATAMSVQATFILYIGFTPAKSAPEIIKIELVAEAHFGTAIVVSLAKTNRP